MDSWESPAIEPSIALRPGEGGVAVSPEIESGLLVLRNWEGRCVEGARKVSVGMRQP
jgi:hypothetical protein